MVSPAGGERQGRVAGLGANRRPPDARPAAACEAAGGFLAAAAAPGGVPAALAAVAQRGRRPQTAVRCEAACFSGTGARSACQSRRSGMCAACGS